MVEEWCCQRISGLQRCLLVLLLALLPLSAVAEVPAGPGLFLVRGVFGLPDKMAGELDVPYIHPAFLSAVGADTGAPVDQIAVLDREFDAAFGKSRVASVTSRNKARTYAVSLQVTRADMFEVDLGQHIDVYLPLAVNIYITNILSGEVLFSLGRTRYQNLRETPEGRAGAEFQSRVAAAFRANYEVLVHELMQDASARFRPFQVSANVRSDWKGYLLLDAGLDKGVATGNELVNADGAGVRVIYADRNYSVGVPSLGIIKPGEVVSLYSTVSAGSIRKPRVLVLSAKSPSMFPGHYAAMQFAENIGDKASFSIVAVNPTFQKVLGSVMGEQGLQQAEVSQNRALPDYFIRIWLPEPAGYDLPTNQSFAVSRVFSGSVQAEMLDASGRVVFATTVSDEIVDQVVSGLAINRDDRLKILYGNLLSDLAAKFIHGVQFNRTELVLGASANGEFQVEDAAGILAVNQNVRAFRVKDDLVKDLGDVRIPVWDMLVVARAGNIATLVPVAPTAATADDALKLRAGDRLLLEGARAGASRLSFQLCATSKDLGDYKVPNMAGIAYFSAGQWFKAPFFVGDYPVSSVGHTFLQALDELDHAGFSRPIKKPTVTSGYCVEPVVKITEKSRDCSKSDRCSVGVDVLAGLQVRQGDSTPLRKAQSMLVEFSGVPEAVVDGYVVRKAELKLQELFQNLAQQLDVSALP